MAVIIDTVYQRVLAVANKEQRGYITPQEFNLLANQAQLEIFEQYFYDINQFNRLHGNSTEYSDMLDNINEKLSPFQKYMQDVTVTAASVGTLPAGIYRLGTLIYVGDTRPIEMEEVQPNELINLENAPLTRATLTHPYYIRLTDTTVELYPSTELKSSTKIRCNYVTKPAAVRWGFTLINDKALYNNSSTYTTNFELHESEETNLVIKILELSGAVIKQPDVYQIADKEKIQKIQQEKS